MWTQNLNEPLVPDEDLLRCRHNPIPRGTKLLGKYVVERMLGQGGMGIVVAARHETLEELVAIKFLLPAAMTNQQAVERFLREARASARLRSDHVVSVQDVGKLETGEPYMIMEYLEGEDLKSILRKRGQLPLVEAVDYALQACKGVAAAHAKNIVHRDLKPANLFLATLADGTSRVKVFDFGIARIVEPNEKDLTRNDIVGSLAYMSPEQLLKSRTADWRTDIWSLGVILCELLTTKRPFDGEGRHELIANIFEAEPPPLRTWRDDVPPAMELVLRRCLRKDRNERYQSANEVGLALCEAAGLPPPVRGPMASLSFSEPYGLPNAAVIAETTVGSSSPARTKHEETANTVADFSVTRHPASSLRSTRMKAALAGAVLLATSAGVVGLVAALRGSKAETIMVHAGAAQDASGAAMPIAPVQTTFLPTDIANSESPQRELNAGPASIGTPIGKTVSAMPTTLTMPTMPASSALSLESATPIQTVEPRLPNAPMRNDVPLSISASTSQSTIPGPKASSVIDLGSSVPVSTTRPPIKRKPIDNDLSDLKPD